MDKRIKKIALMAALALVFALSLGLVIALACEPEDNIDIDVEKIWEHGENPEAKWPTSVTVKLMDGSKTVQTITLSKGSDGKWKKGTFTNVPRVPASGSYTVTEDPVPDDYTAVITQPVIGGAVTISSWSDKKTPASNSTYSIGTADMIVAKKGGDYYIWTLEDMSAAQKSQIIAAVNAAKLPGLGKTLTLSNTEFENGLPAVFNTNKGPITVKKDGNNNRQIIFETTKVWSLFYYGTMQTAVDRDAVITNTFTGDIEPETGRLVVTKEVIAPAGFASDESFEITVIGPDDYEEILYLKHGQSGTLDNLPCGVYTISENEEDAAITNYTLLVSGGGNVTLDSENTSASVTVTNTYTLKTGSLTISKTLAGDATSSSDEFEFTVTLKDSRGAPLSGSFSYTGSTSGTISSGGTLTLKGGESITISGLPVGTDYAVAETNSRGYTPSSTNASGEITEDGATASFTNTKNIPRVNITVNKIWSDNDFSNRPASITVQLYKNGSKEGTPITLPVENAWTYTWEGLDANHTWTVDEVNVPDGYAKSISQNGNSFTITNTLQTGSLTVEKRVADREGAVDDDQEFSFTVTGPYNYRSTFKLEHNETKTLNNLPYGVYRVSEDKEAAEIDDYTLIVSGEETVSINDANKHPSVRITNTYTQEVGELRITKRVDAPRGFPANKRYAFTITNTDTDEEYTLRITGAGSNTITLPVGRYRVEEDNARESGYRWTVEGEGRVNITSDDLERITVTNYYEETSTRPDPPLITIIEQPTPTSPAPPQVVEILEGPAPLGNIPATGDNSLLLLYLALALISGTGLVALALRRR